MDLQRYHGVRGWTPRPQFGTVLLPPRSRERSLEPEEGTAQRGTILVVDDDEGVRTVARRALALAGYQVVTAVNGAEGVRVFERHAAQVRLVLMDVTMPEMNGFEALKRIRATGSVVPVLLSSGYDVDPSRAEASLASGILEKPYDVRGLLRAIERALGA